MEKQLKITIKTDAKTGELKAYTSELNRLEKATKRATGGIDEFATRIKKMAHLGVSIYAIKEMIQALNGLTGGFIHTASEFEKFEAVLKTIEGSSAKAKESMKWITDFTKNTPYQLAEVTEAFVKLKAYGIDAGKNLKVLGDTASAMGKPLIQAVEAMADAVNSEFERLKEFGIKAKQQGDKVAFSWANASGEMKHIVIENNANIIESTLKVIWNSKYEDAMKEQSKTWSGMLSNLNDNWTLFKKQVMDAGLFDYLKSMLNVLLDSSKKSFSKSAEHAKTWTNVIIDGINSVIGSVGFLVDAFNGIKLVLKSIEIGFAYLVKGIVKAFNFANESANKLIEVYNKAVKLFGGKPIEFRYALRDESVVNSWIEGTKEEIKELSVSLNKQLNPMKIKK